MAGKGNEGIGAHVEARDLALIGMGRMARTRLPEYAVHVRTMQHKRRACGAALHHAAARALDARRTGRPWP